MSENIIGRGKTLDNKFDDYWDSLLNSESDSWLDSGLHSELDSWLDSAVDFDLDRDSCPSSEEVVGYYERRLSASARQEIEHHFMGCSFCGEEIEMLTVLGTEAVSPPIPSLWRYRLSGWFEHLEKIGQTILRAVLQSPPQLAFAVRGGNSTPLRKAKPIQMTRIYDADEYEIHFTITPPAIAEEIWKIHGEIYHSILDEFSGEIYLFQSDNLAREAILDEDEDGEFAFDDLQAGEYSLLVNTAEAALHIDGFRLEWTPPELADLLLSQAQDNKKNFARLLEQLRPNLTLELIEEFKRRVDGEMYRNASRALEIAEMAEMAADFISNPEAKALVLRAKGNPLHLLVRNQEALICMKKAEKIYAELGQPFNVAVMQLNQVAVLREIGEYKNAITLYYETRKTCKNIGSPAQRDLALANLEMNIGATYQQMGHLPAALEAYERAYALFASLPGGGQETRMAMIDINRANVLEEMDRFSEAESLYIRARDVLAHAGHEQEVARAELNLGILAYRRGQYQAALRYLETAYKGFTSVANETEIAVVNLYRSFVYRHLNMLQETIDLATSTEQTFEQESMPWPQAQALINQGIAHQRLSEYAEADERLAKAQGIFEKQGAIYRAQQLNLDRADVAWLMGDLKAAQDLAHEVQTSLDLAMWPSLAARHHILLARCALASAIPDLAIAREHTEQAQAIANSHQLHEVTIAARYLMGQILERSGDLEAAWLAYNSAIEKIEWLRALLAVDEFLLGFMEDKLPIYKNTVRLCHHMATQATNGKSISLAQMFYTLNLAVAAPLRRLSSSEKGEPTSDDQLLRQELDLLRQRWYWDHSKVEHILNIEKDEQNRPPLGGESVDPTDADLAAEELRQLEDKIAKLMRALRIISTPLSSYYTGAIGISVDSADDFLADVQAHLKPEERLLQYYIVDEQVQALLVTSNSIRLVQDLTSISKLDETRHKWLEVVKKITTIGLSQHKFNKVKSRLRAFYKKLVVPIEPYLTDCEKIFLVIPPDWHNFPFSAFFHRQTYLANRFQLAYLSAPEALLRTGGKSLAEANREVDSSNALVLGCSNKGEVPQTVDEARQIAQLLTPHLPTTLLLEEEATLSDFKKSASNSRLLHLASHAVFRTDNPLFSWVRLADHDLTVLELYDQITLSQQPLVVLSACQTGLGQPRGGGLLGMARGFMVAGANGLIVTLWKVADDKTAELMRDFYTALLNHAASPSAALHYAKQQAIARGDHPYHWAGFIFIQG